MRLTPLEVGPAPSDWGAVPIGKVAEYVTNGFVGASLPHQVDDEGAILYIQGFNVRPNRIDLSGAARVASEFAGAHSKSQLKEGDVVVVQSGHIGTAAVIRAEHAGANCHALIIIRPNKWQIEPDFLSQYLNSELGQRRMQGLHVGSSIKHINTSELADFRVPLPDLGEQRRIAAILKTWDDAINALQHLSDTKLRLFQSLSHQFFSPCHPKTQTRPRGWKRFRLGQVFSERAEVSVDSDELLSITMDRGVIPRNEVGRVDTSPSDKSAYKLICPGDIGYNTMRMWQGVSGLSDYRGVVSPAYTVVVPDDVNILGRFAAHLFKSRRMIFEFERFSQGLTSDTWNLKFPRFAEIEVWLPPIDIQFAQAELLDAARTELDLLSRQSGALKIQKRGLMQRLLTGEWRLPGDLT